MDYETIETERRGGELRIRSNRPEAMNAWNTQFGARPARRGRGARPPTTTSAPS